MPIGHSLFCGSVFVVQRCGPQTDHVAVERRPVAVWQFGRRVSRRNAGEREGGARGCRPCSPPRNSPSRRKFHRVWGLDRMPTASSNGAMLAEHYLTIPVGKVCEHGSRRIRRPHDQPTPNRSADACRDTKPANSPATRSADTDWQRYQRPWLPCRRIRRPHDQPTQTTVSGSPPVSCRRRIRRPHDQPTRFDPPESREW